MFEIFSGFSFFHSHYYFGVFSIMYNVFGGGYVVRVFLSLAFSFDLFIYLFIFNLIIIIVLAKCMSKISTSINE